MLTILISRNFSIRILETWNERMTLANWEFLSWVFFFFFPVSLFWQHLSVFHVNQRVLILHIYFQSTYNLSMPTVLTWFLLIPHLMILHILDVSFVPSSPSSSTHQTMLVFYNLLRFLWAPAPQPQKL